MCFEIQTLKTYYIHDGRATKPTPLAQRKDPGRYEGREDCEAHHLQPLGGQPGVDPVRQCAQACGERGHRRGLARPCVQHQPQSHRRSCKQLSRAKRVAGPG